MHLQGGGRDAAAQPPSSSLLLIHSRALAHGMVLPKSWYRPSLVKGATLLG